MTRLIIFAAASALIAGAALSEETVPINAVVVSKDDFTVVELAEDLTVISVKIDEEIVAPDGHPMNGATGNCWGSVAVTAAGAEGAGHCNYSLTDGDAWVIRWKAAPDMTGGEWEIVGGTGKFAGATGNGTYVNQGEGEPTKLTGEVVLK